MQNNKRVQNDSDSDILFSKSIKAGQRIYYLDVKKNKRGDMYVCTTESKKTVSGQTDMPQVSFEKHKIFIFQEDFHKFSDSLLQVMKFVTDGNDEVTRRDETDGEIEIDMDFQEEQ